MTEDNKNTENNALYKLLCVVLCFLGLKHNIIQYKFGRRLFKGRFYYLYPSGLSMCNFWSEKEITSCQTKVITYEDY